MVSQPLVSWHLTILRRMEFVRTRRQGREVYCSLDAARYQQCVAMLAAVIGEQPARQPARVGPVSSGRRSEKTARVTVDSRVMHIARASGRGTGRGAGNKTAPRRQGANVGNKKVRVGIIGVGNCASSLVQGVEYYKQRRRRRLRPRADARQPGRLSHPRHRVLAPPSTSTRTRWART